MDVKLTMITRLTIIALCMLLASCKEDVYTELSEKQANEMLSVLERQGVEAEKKVDKEGFRIIRVDSSEFSKAIEVLRSSGYPKEKFDSMGELFKKEGLISSPLEEKVRFLYALSQNISETLTQIDGVITARVHIVLPENNPFGEEVRPSSASVFIKYGEHSNVDRLKSDIKMIVEKSVEGLSYDKVSVVLVPSEVRSSAPQGENGEDGWSVYPILAFLSLMLFFAISYYLYERFIEKKDVQHPVGMPTVTKNE